MNISPVAVTSSRAFHVFQGVAVIVEHCLVGLQQRTLLVHDKDKLRKVIDKLPQFPLALPEFIFSLLAIINISACTVPADDLAGFIPEWLGANEEPAVGSVMPAKTRLDFVWFS